MKKIILLLICLYLVFQYINNKSNEPQNNQYEIKNLYQQFRNLEDLYERKLLIAHGIDPDKLYEELDKYEEPKQKAEVKKHYIMNEGNLTEKEYEDKFIHPIEQITNRSTNTIKDIENTYNEVKDKFDSLERLIHDLTS